MKYCSPDITLSFTEPKGEESKTEGSPTPRTAVKVKRAFLRVYDMFRRKEIPLCKYLSPGVVVVIARNII